MHVKSVSRFYTYIQNIHLTYVYPKNIILNELQASVVDTYGISWADAIVMGGIAGVQAFGGKVPFNVTMGRCDDATVNPKVRQSMITIF